MSLEIKGKWVIAFDGAKHRRVPVVLRLTLRYDGRQLVVPLRLLGLSRLLGGLNNGGLGHRVTGLFAAFFREHGQTYDSYDCYYKDEGNEFQLRKDG
jgi:hypothetical protein